MLTAHGSQTALRASRPIVICIMAHLPLCGGQCIDPATQMQALQTAATVFLDESSSPIACGGKTRDDLSSPPPLAPTTRRGGAILSIQIFFVLDRQAMLGSDHRSRGARRPRFAIASARDAKLATYRDRCRAPPALQTGLLEACAVPCTHCPRQFASRHHFPKVAHALLLQSACYCGNL